MAIEISPPEDSNAGDPCDEIALERALAAWRIARAWFDRIEPTKLSNDERDAYVRAIVRIGLWSDEKVSAAPGPRVVDGDDPDELDEG